jgi:hypothetical protein
MLVTLEVNMIERKLPDERRFTVAVKLNRAELTALDRVTDAERLNRAQVVRRLIWQAAQQTTAPAGAQEVRP